VKKSKISYIDIEIDELTNSIENTISGDSFVTEVLPLKDYDILEITKKKGWQFNWRSEFKSKNRQLFKLTILGNPGIVQGLISITDENDHYFVHLIESAPFNIGKNKLYIGVPGNLMAFACKTSKENGYKGFVAFVSKSKLISHYRENLGATPFGRGSKMIIYPPAAEKLINKYFK
jgi:hypothetical protein